MNVSVKSDSFKILTKRIDYDLKFLALNCKLLLLSLEKGGSFKIKLILNTRLETLDICSHYLILLNAKMANKN